MNEQYLRRALEECRDIKIMVEQQLRRTPGSWDAKQALAAAEREEKRLMELLGIPEHTHDGSEQEELRLE